MHIGKHTHSYQDWRIEMEGNIEGEKEKKGKKGKKGENVCI